MVQSIRSKIRVISSALLVLAFLSLCLIPARIDGQRFPANGASRKTNSADQTIAVLFLSDIHFDPFHDPGKAKQLADAPESEWNSIFALRSSDGADAAFEALQKKCGAKGVDTPPALLDSAIAAMKARQPETKFMLVSGDLVVHDFPCRYKTLFPDAPAADYEAFVLKTISYVARELRGTFPGMPVYAALGNNDSGCQDYRLDANSEFFAKAGEILSAGIQVAQQNAMKTEFAMEGNYNILLPLPMRNTRLIVLNDTFESTKYKTCAGAKDSKGPDVEIAWFKKQLADARRAGQRVWVMGHIPPGVDPYATAEKFKDVCGGEDPVMFLTSTAIPDLMTEYGDEIKLGIFAHTHMDEMRLLRREGADHPGVARGVPVKMIPSISPVHGNRPSFTVALVSASSATLKDYTVMAASSLTGEDTKWTPEYSYSKAYGQQEFSSAALQSTIEKFDSDNLALLPESENYLRSYFVGDHIKELTPFWMQYACVLNNYTSRGYAACVCHTGK